MKIAFLKFFLPTLLMTGVFNTLYGVESDQSTGFWFLRSLSGELALQRNYQGTRSTYNEIGDFQESRFINGGIKLNTSSYLWRPDIFSIDLNGEYFPETRREKYLTIPDRAELRTLKRIDLRTTLFSDRFISLTSYINFHSNYFNRENITNIRSNNRQYGFIFSLNNKILPLNISYRSVDWDQFETDSGLNYSIIQSTLQTTLSKSFAGNDRSELIYSHDRYQYRYSEVFDLANEVNRASMSNSVYLGKERRGDFNSLITYYNQTGTTAFNKIDAVERLNMRIVPNLLLKGSYNMYRMEDNTQLYTINRARGQLQHQLYESLRSEIYSDYSATDHTLFSENILKAGLLLNYTKKIRSSRLNLGYEYFRQQNNLEGSESTITIVNEEHSLGDIEGILLEKAYIDLATLMITDATGTIIYLEGVDYTLFSLNGLTRIFRIPGGQIAQDQIIMASYTAIVPGSHSYTANNNRVNASLLLFGSILEIYYSGSMQEFGNLESAQYLTLNSYYQNIAGGKLNLKSLTAGIEYDNYNSSIVPYRRVLYYLNLNLRFSQKLLFSMNSSYRDYLLLDEDLNQRYTNISGRISYKLDARSVLSVQSGYLDQHGRNIDLALLTGKIEFATRIRQLQIKAGYNKYYRRYTQSSFNYSGSYIQLIRKF